MPSKSARHQRRQGSKSGPDRDRRVELSAEHRRPIATTASPPRLAICDGWDDYRLIDSGGRRKLERYGALTLVRPDDQALWQPALDPAAWEKADAVFSGGGDHDGGRWALASGTPQAWPLTYGPINLQCRFTSFRHIGVFPEQAPHWDWMTARIGVAKRPPRILNLFGYTGVASLLCAAAGAHVTHVDASKTAIAWARENQTLSSLGDRPVRWICDDATKFCAREVRRGNLYDGIILDPPKFGRGPKNETWQIYEDLPEMMKLCRQLMSAESDFLVLTAYSIRSSYLSMQGLAAECLADLGGNCEAGELALREEAGGRLLPTSLFVRWSRS